MVLVLPAIRGHLVPVVLRDLQVQEELQVVLDSLVHQVRYLN